MSRIQKSKSYLAIAFLALFAFSTIISILPAQKAKAAEWSADNNHIVEEVYRNTSAHQHYYWLYSCFRNHDIDKVTRGEVDSWDFFEGGDENIATLGAMYEGDGGNIATGARDCDSEGIVEQAFKYLGFTDSRETFCSITGKQYGGEGVSEDTCNRGVDGDPDHWDNDADNEERAEWLKDNADKPPFGGAEEYVRAYKTLVSPRGCKINFPDSTLYNSDNDVPGAADANDIYAVPVFVASTGGGYDLKYIKGVGSSSGTEVNYVANTNHSDYINDITTERTCGEIVEEYARGNASAYATWLRENEDAADDDTDGGGSGNTDPTCESEGGVLAWMLCGALEVIDSIISWLDYQINSLLFIDDHIYSKETLGEAWEIIRNLALLILVPMMMFMVIGTALSFGPFDPYTVKKALPRMFIAVIFIVLSLPICQFAVQVSNVAGQGLGNIIINAAPDPVNHLSDIFSDTSGGTQEGLGLTALVAGIVGLALGGLGVLISFGAVAIVGLLIGFVILVMRQVLIVTLIVLAPLAILTWIFPGNDKMWGIWKGTFLAMLLMYPIITVLLAAGKFVAGILG